MVDDSKLKGPDKRPDQKDTSGFNKLIEKMNDDSTESISVYLKKIGLWGQQNCLVLTADDHYYYGEEDLRSIQILINLKRMNLIKDQDKFLHNLFRILSPNANFIGCFKDTKAKSGHLPHPDKTSGLLNWFISFLERKPEHGISKSDVKELLDTHGFRIVDMTDIDDLTFFWSRNARKQQASA